MTEYEQIKQAVSACSRMCTAADDSASEIASLLVGRLRKVRSQHTLNQLKMELSKYNRHTGRWSR